MSQPSDRLTVSRAHFRERFQKIRRSRRGTLGVAEIIGLALAGLMLLAVIVGYLYFQLPAQSRVTTLVRERDHLEQQLREATAEFKRGLSIKDRVDVITGSVKGFEDKRLVERDAGRLVLYADLNQMIHKNDLRNTSGPAYTTLDPLGLKTEGQTAPAASNTTANKWQSLYPGIAVNVTVEGPYQNIRHFVGDIESSKEFIIINAVELERATESNSQSGTATGTGKAGSGNALVSLRLDLATYYRRLTPTSEKTAVITPTVH